MSINSIRVFPIMKSNDSLYKNHYKDSSKTKENFKNFYLKQLKK